MKQLIIFLILFYTTGLKAQFESKVDTLDVTTNGNAYKFSPKKLIIPSVFISYGILSLTNDGLKEINTSTRHESSEHITPGAMIDNYMQYAPVVAVYGLDLAGVKGNHNFKDRTIIYVTAHLIMSAIVIPTKNGSVKNVRMVPARLHSLRDILQRLFLLLILCSGNIKTPIFG